MKNVAGFTVTETLVSIIFAGVVATTGYTIYEALQMTHRDQERKTAVNAIHYNLEEVVRPKLGAYPRTLSAAQLTAMDETLLKDPNGIPAGKQGSDYRYEATGCNGSEKCTGYQLRADLERETDFIKTARR